jgi:transcriptional regulator with XRE-family HTH domain
MRETALGRLIRNLRNERGLTLREVAALVGTTYTTIYRLENGVPQYPSALLLGKIVGILQPENREREIIGFLMGGAGPDPDLVDFTRQEPTMTAAEFRLIASLQPLNIWPDYQTSLARARWLMRQDGWEALCA